jgi:hypothetical protein
MYSADDAVWARGSGVQGCILVPGQHLGCVFTRKASASSGLIQNLEPNWQLFGKMSIFNEDFGSLMPSLSLTLNPAFSGKPVNGYGDSLSVLLSGKFAGSGCIL